MAVDYDLVVIGNSASSRRAAIAAKHHAARVALITVAPDSIPHHLLLQRWVQACQQRSDSTNCPTRDSVSLEQWTTALNMTLQAPTSPAQLASLGIEQLEGVAQFRKKPKLQVHVKDRVFNSRRYLLALDTDFPLPTIPGLSLGDYLTPASLIQSLSNLEHPLPSPTIILGDGPIAISLCQSLARLGHPVSLISQNAHILPREDADAAFWLQAHLEADGVQVYTCCQVEQVSQSDQGRHVMTNIGALPASSIVWAQESHIAAINPNLVGITLRHTSQGLWVNAHLQTSQPRIYACGSVLGGYSLPDITQFEARLAIKNALGWRQRSIEYQTMAWSLATQPAFARVGFTETQAQQKYHQIQVLRQSYPDLEGRQPQGKTSGWCKLMVQQQGYIVGAYVVGAAAAEIIQMIALAMKKRCIISELADQVCLQSSYANVVGEAAKQWQKT